MESMKSRAREPETEPLWRMPEPPACACTVEGQVAISEVRSETHRARVEALARTGEPLTEIGRSYNVRFGCAP